MARWEYRKGLHEIGNGCFAWLQPDGGWNLSNAGLIAGPDEAMLIDTLTDVPLTMEMLLAMRSAASGADNIRAIVNTHSHPDHCAGNCCIGGAEVITSVATGEEMAALAKFDFMQGIIEQPQRFGSAGQYFHEVMGSKFDMRFDFYAQPTRTFESELTVDGGGHSVQLIKVGPAHTQGDVIAWIPDQKIMFTGDILFHEVHPLISGEMIDDWVAALDRAMSYDVAVVVPGHGPITDRSGLAGLRDYLIYFKSETRARFDAGLSFADAVRDISIDAFRGWADEERIFMNVSSLYRSFGAEPIPMDDVMQLTLNSYRQRTSDQNHV